MPAGHRVPPGRLATPGVADVAGLALRRCYEGLQSGRSAVSVRDAVVLVRLAHEIEHDAALAERDAARRQMEEWRQEFKSGLWAVRSVLLRQYGQDAWAAFWPAATIIVGRAGCASVVRPVSATRFGESSGKGSATGREITRRPARAGASIGGADFTGADLAGADLTFALAAADLNGANFAGARLDGAKWPDNVPVPGAGS